MKISTAEVDEIVRSVMDLTLRLQADELQTAAVHQGEATMVRAEILFKGGWKGSVLLQIEPSLAREMAAVMMQKEPADTADAEAMDAVGEIANMIAGNLKPLFPGQRSMSLPKVSQAGLSHLPHDAYPLALSYLLDGRGLSIELAENRSQN